MHTLTGDTNEQLLAKAKELREKDPTAEIHLKRTVAKVEEEKPKKVKAE